LIIHSIAETNESLGKSTVIIPQLDSPSLVAVFAVPNNPIIIWGDRTLQLGDWATIGGEHGFLIEINRGSVILKTQRGSREFIHRIPKFLGFTSYDIHPISIFPPGQIGAFNLNRILQEVCHIDNHTFINREGVDGVISGTFDHSSYEAFLTRLAGEFDCISFVDDQVIVTKDKLPISIIGLESYWSQTTSLRELFKSYEPHVGYRCIYRGNNQATDWTFPAMQFHTLIDQMDMELEIQEQNLLIKEREVLP
jgi:hypothetical protein